MKHELTARQELEIRGVFYYMVAYGIIFAGSHITQFIAKVPVRQMIPAITISTINMTMAFIVYRNKLAGKKSEILPWVIGFLSVSSALSTKYSYAGSLGWTFAAQSYNSTIIMVTFAIMLYLFYQKNLYRFFAVFTMVNLILFFYIAYTKGAEIHYVSHVKGVPVTSGVIFLREIFMYIGCATSLFVAYRSIPDIIEFEETIAVQTSQITRQADAQRSMTEIIKDKMNILFQKVNGQHELINRFNSRMETQSSSFSEMSATMEELAGSAEQIASESISQIDGNIKMESIVDEFKNIQAETKQNLAKTYSNIQSVSDKSTVANEQLQEVEKTVSEIKEQSGRIGETVNLIVDIADKINLLSLNASIEAARAGEAGRGFAVVADEIGKLAFQTQESIKEINKVLSDSSRNTVAGVTVIQKTAEMMREMITHMGQGAHTVQLLQESIFVEEKYIGIIVGQMNNNISQAKKIGSATDEQKVAVESTSHALEDLIVILNEMVGEMNKLTQTTHEIRANAEELMTDAGKAAGGTDAVG